MTVVRILLTILALAAGLAVLVAGWWLVQFQVLYPWRYARAQDEARAWNAKTYETGTALKVTLQVSSNDALGAETATATLYCFRKMLANQGGLKGPPGTFQTVFSEGPDDLTLPFGPGATHQTSLRDACFNAIDNWHSWQLPHSVSGGFYWSMIVAEDRGMRCFLGNDPRTTKGEVTRLSFVSIEEVALKDAVDAEAFLSLQKPVTRAGTESKTYYWFEEEQPTCWRHAQGDACAPELQDLCGVPTP